MPVAVNGNVNGAQLWIADHHWWDYPEIWKLPKRPEDGQLDWERLFPHQRDVIRRFSATLRRLSGLPEALPRVPYQPFGSPNVLGWVMPIRSGTHSELRYGKCTSGGSVVSHHPIRGTDTFALLVSAVGENPWFVVRADGHPWHANPWANNTRVGSIWVRVLAWQHTSDHILPFAEIAIRYPHSYVASTSSVPPTILTCTARSHSYQPRQKNASRFEMSLCGGKNQNTFGGSIFFSQSQATQTIFGMGLTLSTSATLIRASSNTRTCSAIGHHPTSPPPGLYNISALHRRNHERRQHQELFVSPRVTTPESVGHLPRICRHIHHGAAHNRFSRAHSNIA